MRIIVLLRLVPLPLALLMAFILANVKSFNVWSSARKKPLGRCFDLLPPSAHGASKDTDIRLIDTLAEKEALLAKLGVDHIVVHPFSKAFSRQTADSYPGYFGAII